MSFDHPAALAYPWPVASGWSVNFDLILKIAIASDRPRRCFICGAEVLVGEEARVRWESPKAGGKSRFHYGCAGCCAAMAAGEAAVAARRMRRSA